MSVLTVLSLHGQECSATTTAKTPSHNYSPGYSRDCSALCVHEHLCSGLSSARVVHQIRRDMVALNMCQFDVFQRFVGVGLGMGPATGRAMGAGQEQDCRVRD